jgi:hypothetical protein
MSIPPPAHDSDRPSDPRTGDEHAQRGGDGAPPFAHGQQGGHPGPGHPEQAPAGYPPGPGFPVPGGHPPHGGPPAAAVGDPLVATSFSDWWSKVVGVLARSWKPLLVIQLATVVPGMIISALVLAAVASPSTVVTVGGAVIGLLGGLIVFVVALLAQGASVYVVGKQASGQQEVGAGAALNFAAGRALPLLGWGILAALMIGLGFVLLVIPGIYLLVVFAAALTGVIMFERAGIGRTFGLVNPAFGQTLGRLLSFAVAAMIYSGIVGAVVGALVGREGFASGLLSNVLTLPVTFASVGVAVVTYASLRNRENPAVTTAQLAADLDRP